jgi:hypothetical protein
MALPRQPRRKEAETPGERQWQEEGKMNDELAHLLFTEKKKQLVHT